MYCAYHEIECNGKTVTHIDTGDMQSTINQLPQEVSEVADHAGIKAFVKIGAQWLKQLQVKRPASDPDRYADKGGGT